MLLAAAAQDMPVIRGGEVVGIANKSVYPEGIAPLAVTATVLAPVVNVAPVAEVQPKVNAPDGDEGVTKVATKVVDIQSPVTRFG